MHLPNITKKQQTIVQLLYTYRFLNRIQIQALLRHKDKKTVNVWLKDLVEKQYIGRIYSNHFLAKTKPAVFYLALNGVRWLRQQTVVDEEGNERTAYSPEEIRKRYRDKHCSESFRDRSMLLADCCIPMLAQTGVNVHHRFYTQTELAEPDNEFHFLTEGDLASQLGPQLCIRRQQAKTTVNYLVEIFDEQLPRYRMSRRIRQYLQFLSDGDWQAERDDEPPTILFVCYRLADLIYAKRRTRRLIADEWYGDAGKPHIWFMTADTLKQEGYLGTTRDTA